MEREIIKKTKRMKTEDLLRLIERGGLLALEAAEEILARREFGIEGEYLREILEIGKISPMRTEEATKIKNEAANIIIERFLNERNFLAILREVESQIILEKATRKYRSQVENIPNYVLKEIVRRVPSEREWAGRKLLKQAKTTDDLLVIEEELTGILQIKADEKHWKMGKSLEDACWHIEFVEPLAEGNWTKIRHRIKEMEVQRRAELYYEISRYTESQKVKREVLNEMWIIREDLTEEQLNHLEQNAGLVTIEDPEKVRNWINQHFLKAPISFDEALKVKERTKSNIIRKEAIKEAIKKGKKEIRKIERELKKHEEQERYWPGPTWKKDRLEFLRNKVLELERELENLEREKEIEESVLQGGDNMEMSTLVQT